MFQSGPRKEIPPASVRSLTCPGCGASVVLRSFGKAVNVVCGSCHSVLDAQDPQVKILQEFKDTLRRTPKIPLGARGKLRNILFEIIGFQHRQIEADGQIYGWDEYLLFNPYQGFRYLTEFDGHWNFVAPLRTLPQAMAPGIETDRYYLGERYKHFQTAVAKTTFVLGEFPWQVRVGETAEVTDYVSPPRVLSAEVTADKEVNWSMGEYMTGAGIWKTFNLKDQPPVAVGVYENQPSPFGDAPRKLWRYCFLFLAVATVLWIANLVTASNKQVFSQGFSYDPKVADSALVTNVFEMDGRASPVEVKTATSVDNQWIYLDYTLINDQTGETYDFGREISFYRGYEDGESWSEGATSDSVTLPAIPPGRYFLRIEPEGDKNLGEISYLVTVTRGSPTSVWFLIAVPMLVIPAVLSTWRSISFEHQRWQESDHAPIGFTAGGDSDDDDGDDDDDS